MIRWRLPELAAAASVGLLVVAFGACVRNAQIAAYEADGLACVAEAGTRAEADACRCALERRNARPPVHCDAGAP